MGICSPYLDNEGRIASWPARKKSAARAALLDLLAPVLAHGEEVDEREVNDRLAARITAVDHAYFRRELVDSGRWARTADGRRYWRPQAMTND